MTDKDATVSTQQTSMQQLGSEIMTDNLEDGIAESLEFPDEKMAQSRDRCEMDGMETESCSVLLNFNSSQAVPSTTPFQDEQMPPTKDILEEDTEMIAGVSQTSFGEEVVALEEDFESYTYSLSHMSPTVDDNVDELEDADTDLPHEDILYNAFPSYRTKVPGLYGWLEEHKDWLEMCNRFSLKQTVMDEILKKLNCPASSWKTVRKAVCQISGVEPKIEYYAMCPGHIAYVDMNGDPQNECSVCGKQKPLF
ncbi:hypothetical protein FGB62_57g04 [Gracilaria domingensis]|nr:hypothetical protein FGB62_57g04 [Gracilaria domingensis]